MTAAAGEHALQLLVQERAIRRRAQRMWRVISIIAGVGLGLVGWAWSIAGFGFFQFLAYATYWHSVRTIEAETGLSESAQALLLARFDVMAARQS